MKTDEMFRHLMARLQRSPLWQEDLADWTWNTSIPGRLQTLAPQAREHPGHANLLWLAMKKDWRPDVYDAHENALFVWVAQHGQRPERIPGWPAGSLADVAEVLSLEEFSRLPPIAGPVAILIDLAKERVRNGKA